MSTGVDMQEFARICICFAKGDASFCSSQGLKSEIKTTKVIINATEDFHWTNHRSIRSFSVWSSTRWLFKQR